MSSFVHSARVRPALVRPRASLVTGVSAGLATHLGWPVAVVRVTFLALAPLAGAGVLLYLWLWLFVPIATEPRALPVTRAAPVAWIAMGLAVVAALGVALGSYVYLGYFIPTISSLVPSLLAQLLCLFAALWAGFLDINDPARGPKHSAAVRAVATVFLLILVITYGVDFGIQAGGMLPFIAAITAVLCLGGVYAPMLVRSIRDATSERIRRIREEQRSEMAAHLHDSVLQTLALIQNRAGASSEAARLARAQERELRSWLYDGDEPADSDLPTDLRDYAAALELDYPVVMDVVAAGASTERASGEVAAAAREAMLNAARHAPGPISVYIEGSQRAVDVFVRDRGSGFDLDAVPGDRLGIRQSIVGRMRRAGGDARVIRRENGTEIHLTLDYDRAASARAQEMS